MAACACGRVFMCVCVCLLDSFSLVLSGLPVNMYSHATVLMDEVENGSIQQHENSPPTSLNKT